MKKILFIFIVLLPFIGISQTDLVRWNGANLQPNAFLIINNGTISANPVNGSYVTDNYSQPFPGFRGTNYNASATTPDYTNFMEFAIKANATNEIKLTQFTFTHARGEGGPQKFEVRYSTDNSIGTAIGEATTVSQNATLKTIDLTGITVQPNQTFYIRVYPFNRQNPDWKFGTFHIKHGTTYSGGTPDATGPTFRGTVLSLPVNPITTWNGAAGWSNGVPTTTKDAIIEADYQVQPNEVLSAKNLTINTSAKLTVASEGVLLVQNNTTVLSNLESITPQIIIENNGSFVQVNDNATYTGSNTSFMSKRSTQLVNRYDFTYWSSPVEDFILKSVSPITLFDKFFSWNSVAQNWTVHKSNAPVLEKMAPGKGYTVRAPQNFNIEGNGPAQIHNAQFIGKPNNGIKEITVSNGAAERWNLIGNPYPSAISVADFLKLNKNVVEGTLYFWTHKTPAAASSSNSSYYTYSTTDYVAANLAGSVANSKLGSESNDNSLGLITSIDFQNIASGQSFFVKGKETNAVGNQVVFNNAMRVQTSAKNNQFFKPGITTPVDNWETTGKHRIWLNLTTSQNDFNQALVGYIEDATNEIDWGYDGEVFSGGAATLYTLSNEKALTIQSRALPFSNQDEVPLGYKTTRTGTITISIDHFDGLFEGQDIYLKDNVLNSVHDLKESEYSFTTVPGTFDNRFTLRYVPQETLGLETPTIEANSIVVFNTNNQISIKSANEPIDQVLIYDLQGRVIFSKDNVSAQEFSTPASSVSHQVVVVKVTTENKAVLVKKVILN